jgi:hypothetical protein
VLGEDDARLLRHVFLTNDMRPDAEQVLDAELHAQAP